MFSIDKSIKNIMSRNSSNMFKSNKLSVHSNIINNGFNNMFKSSNNITNNMLSSNNIKSASVNMQQQWKGFSVPIKNQMRIQYKDTDGDRVPDIFDCNPNNPFYTLDINKRIKNFQDYKKNKDMFGSSTQTNIQSDNKLKRRDRTEEYNRYNKNRINVIKSDPILYNLYLEKEKERKKLYYKDLKKNNPEKYEEKLEKQRQRQNLYNESLKQYPEKYQGVLKIKNKNNKVYYKKVQQNSEKYENLLEHNSEYKQQYYNEHPEKYQENLEQNKENYQKIKQDPEKYQEYLNRKKRNYNPVNKLFNKIVIPTIINEYENKKSISKASLEKQQEWADKSEPEKITEQITQPDADGDGVPDEYDCEPDDPTKDGIPIQKAKHITVYHGTAKQSVPSIMKKGLRGDSDNLIFTTPQILGAESYGRMGGESTFNESKEYVEPAVLKITIPRKKLMNFNNMFEEQNLDKQGKEFLTINEYATKKHIPVKYIKVLTPEQVRQIGSRQIVKQDRYEEDVSGPRLERTGKPRTNQSVEDAKFLLENGQHENDLFWHAGFNRDVIEQAKLEIAWEKHNEL